MTKRLNKELTDSDWAGIFNMFNTPGPIDFSQFNWPEIDNFDLMGTPGEGEPNPNWGLGNRSGDTPENDPYTGKPPGDGGGGSGSGGLSGLWGQLARFFGIGGSGSGSSGGGTGGGGDLTLQSLLPLLGILGGGYGAYAGREATQEATRLATEANREATDFARGQLGQGDQRMLPYTDIGREAIWNLNAMGPRALAGNYQPLGSGRGMRTLGSTAKGR